ncbi:uncharacterized [Tachysurus ichikawai]
MRISSLWLRGGGRGEVWAVLMCLHNFICGHWATVETGRGIVTATLFCNAQNYNSASLVVLNLPVTFPKIFSKSRPAPHLPLRAASVSAHYGASSH